MLLPLGVYLRMLFGMKDVKKTVIVMMLTSAFIETYQIVSTYHGVFFPRTFNVDGIILNTEE